MSPKIICLNANIIKFILSRLLQLISLYSFQNGLHNIKKSSS